MKTFTIICTVLGGALFALVAIVGTAAIALGCGRAVHYFC